MKQTKKKKSEKQGVNYKVVTYSVVALIFLYLSFTVDWLFIVVSAIMMYLNQRELMGK
mgnify:CR=1